MRKSAAIAVSITIACISADVLAQQRPALRGVSSVRIANYGAPSTVLQGREVAEVVAELNELRRQAWQRRDAAIECYSSVFVMSGTRRVGGYRVRPDLVVERPVEKGQAAYTRLIDPADIPRLMELLRKIAPAVCK